MIQDSDVQQLSCFNDGSGDGNIVIIYMENL